MSGRPVVARVEDALPLIGREVGVSEWLTITQAQLDGFAEATGDRQWIHTDPERARREMPGGRTIAHGYLTLALIPALTADFIEFRNLERVINMGCDKLRFYTMVPTGSRVRARASVMNARKRAGALQMVSEVSIDVDGERKPACVAQTLAMYFFRDGGKA